MVVRRSVVGGEENWLRLKAHFAAKCVIEEEVIWVVFVASQFVVPSGFVLVG